MRKPDDVFDRDREWSQLSAFIEDDRAGATLDIVSGRRRQGKSFTDDLKDLARRGEADLVSLADLYG